jgi:plastocyanin
MRALLFGCAVLLAAVPVAGASARNYTVVIEKMKFGPAPGALRVGDTIVWDNRDIFQHSATAADKSFDVDLKAGQKKTTVLRKVGTIAFDCKYHPGMRGVLKVVR